jgi:hypothetical protein
MSQVLATARKTQGFNRYFHPERASRRSRLRAPGPDCAVAPRQADTTLWPSGENPTALTQSEWTNNSNRL